jgi:hypothetical protein
MGIEGQGRPGQPRREEPGRGIVAFPPATAAGRDPVQRTDPAVP